MTEAEMGRDLILKDLEILVAQEAQLQFVGFNGDTAWALGSRLREMAAGRGRPVAMGVWLNGQTMFYATTPGTTRGNEDWLRRKRNVVQLFGRSSYRVGTEMRRDGRTMEGFQGLAPADHADHGGGFPLTLAGTGCVGTIGLSGLAQRDDHALVVEAIVAVTGIEVPRLGSLG